MSTRRAAARPGSVLHAVVTAIGLAMLALVGGCERHGGGGRGSPVSPTQPVFPNHHECPTWSTLDRIAYRDLGIVCVRTSGAATLDPARMGLYVLDPTTGVRTRLLPDGDTPAWSRDGGRLAISYASRILVVDADGTGPITIEAEGGNFWPCWSPSGDRLAWWRSMPEPGIYLANADGTGRRRLVPYGGPPDWHPSLDRLIHVLPSDTASGTLGALIEFQLSDSVSRQVARLAGDVRNPRYSPDGTRIAFSWRPFHESLARIWVMNLDGTGLRALTAGAGGFPAWSPDGRWIVYTRADYTRDLPGNGVLWRVEVATSKETQLLGRWPVACP